jgi:hypothetical protein
MLRSPCVTPLSTRSVEGKAESSRAPTRASPRCTAWLRAGYSRGEVTGSEGSFLRDISSRGKSQRSSCNPAVFRASLSLYCQRHFSRGRLHRQIIRRSGRLPRRGGHSETISPHRDSHLLALAVFQSGKVTPSRWSALDLRLPSEGSQPRPSRLISAPNGFLFILNAHALNSVSWAQICEGHVFERNQLF